MSLLLRLRLFLNTLVFRGNYFNSLCAARCQHSQYLRTLYIVLKIFLRCTADILVSTVPFLMSWSAALAHDKAVQLCCKMEMSSQISKLAPSGVAGAYFRVRRLLMIGHILE